MSLQLILIQCLKNSGLQKNIFHSNLYNFKSRQCADGQWAGEDALSLTTCPLRITHAMCVGFWNALDLWAFVDFVDFVDFALVGFCRFLLYNVICFRIFGILISFSDLSQGDMVFVLCEAPEAAAAQGQRDGVVRDVVYRRCQKLQSRCCLQLLFTC